jgi:hypothetical protein
MSGKKISELQELISLEDNDLLVVVDDSELDIANKSKNVKVSTIRDEISEEVSSEASLRSQQDVVLQENIDAEQLRAQSAESDLQDNIDQVEIDLLAEQSIREGADNALQQEIDSINDSISLYRTGFIKGFRITITSSTGLQIASGQCVSDDGSSLIELPLSSISVTDVSVWKNNSVVSGLNMVRVHVCKRSNNEVYVRISPQTPSTSHSDIVDDPSDKKRYIGSVPMYTNNTVYEFTQTGVDNTRIINFGFNKVLASNITANTILTATTGGYYLFPTSSLTLSLTLNRTASTVTLSVDASNITTASFRCTLDQHDGSAYYPMVTYLQQQIIPSGNGVAGSVSINTNQIVPISYYYNLNLVSNNNELLRLSSINNGGFSINCSGYTEQV